MHRVTPCGNHAVLQVLYTARSRSAKYVPYGLPSKEVNMAASLAVSYLQISIHFSIAQANESMLFCMYCQSLG